MMQMLLARTTMVVLLVYVIMGILVTEFCVTMLTNVSPTPIIVAITHHALTAMALLHAFVLMVLLVMGLYVKTWTNASWTLMTVTFPALFVLITLADITAIVLMVSFYVKMNALISMNVQPTKLIAMLLRPAQTLLVDMNAPV